MFKTVILASMALGLSTSWFVASRAESPTPTPTAVVCCDKGCANCAGCADGKCEDCCGTACCDSAGTMQPATTVAAEACCDKGCADGKCEDCCGTACCDSAGTMQPATTGSCCAEKGATK